MSRGRERKGDTLGAVAGILLFVLCLGGGIAFRTKAPCWVFQLADSSGVPARCLSHFAR